MWSECIFVRKIYYTKIEGLVFPTKSQKNKCKAGSRRVPKPGIYLNEHKSVDCFVWMVCITLSITPQVMVTRHRAIIFYSIFLLFVFIQEAQFTVKRAMAWVLEGLSSGLYLSRWLELSGQLISALWVTRS